MPIRTETMSATVTANNDDEKRGRIRVACVELLGDDDADLPMWVEPIFDWGWFFVPDVGEIVELEVTASSDMDESFLQASIDQLNVKWRGQRYYGNEEADVPTVIHPFFSEENYGKRRGFATPFGHIIMFDDTEGSPKVNLTWASETQAADAEKISQILIDTDGTIKLSVLGKHTIHLKENEIEVKLDEGASLKVVGKDDQTVTNLGDGAVAVAIADHLETFYSQLKTYIENAFVNTAMGPSATITASVGPATSWDSKINSDKLKVPDTTP